ncbi:MAG TPA: SCO family protein [Acidimicrobiales bacterium]|nr:SCO family protein [Acidimicrobiales bacterium]
MGRKRTGWRLLATAGLLAVGLAACSSAPAPPDGSAGSVADRPVPAAIRHLPLTDQAGRRVTLASWPGRTVVVVPFLTLCADICPMTTGNLVQVQRALRADGAASAVVLVEVTVDPGRDTPGRLAAYARLTGARWPLVTESPAVLRRLAGFFGFDYRKVPEGQPPDVDWLTHRPLTYDVDHSDGFVVIDPSGVERFVTGGAPAFHGTLPAALHRFLSPVGRRHLDHPARPSWTPTDLLDAVGWSMGRALPAAPAGGGS